MMIGNTGVRSLCCIFAITYNSKLEMQQRDLTPVLH